MIPLLGVFLLFCRDFFPFLCIFTPSCVFILDVFSHVFLLFTYFSSLRYSSSKCFSSGEKAECVPPWVGLHVRLHRLQHDVRHPDAHLQLGHQSRQRGICSWISGQRKREANLNILVFLSHQIQHHIHHIALQGNGFIASAVIYGVFSIASWLAPSVVAWRGPRFFSFIFYLL